MISISDIEILVVEASTGSTRATILVDQLRNDEKCWSIGMQLFFESSNSLVRFFGLSMVRDFMNGRFAGAYENERSIIRNNILSWVKVPGNLQSTEHFIVNNIANIFALAIKSDFPEKWPNAFTDILSFEELGNCGIDLTVKILNDLDIEVVVFKESRTQEEISRNSRVKDAIREGTIARDLVYFLCSSCWKVVNENNDLSERCLRALSEMIGWIDISLVINSNILFQLYEGLFHQDINSVSCICLYEIVKKGMDPIQKILMIHSIGLIDKLSALFCMNASEGIEDDIGLIIDMILQELMGCWCKFESIAINTCDHYYNQHQQLNIQISSLDFTNIIRNLSITELLQNTNTDVENSIMIVAQMLKIIMPLAINIFMNDDSAVALTVISSIKKVISVMKTQLQSTLFVEILATKYTDWYFLSSMWLNQILTCIYKQAQYSQHYTTATLLDEDGDISEEIEAKNDIRKLFINCCRVYPDICLQLIQAVLSTFPASLASAPFTALEAVLRLLHMFSEAGGPVNTDTINNGVFPSLINAVFKTDIHLHPSPLVLMAYYDIAARYAKIISLDTVCHVVSSMVTTQGLRSSDIQLRTRTAYLLLKICETLGSDAYFLLQSIGSFSDLILTPIGANSFLSEQAEVHLLEAIGLMTAQPQKSMSPTHNNNNNILQLQLLSEMLNVLTGQLKDILMNSHFDRYGEQLSELVGRKFSSMSALARGHSVRGSVPSADLFREATSTGVVILEALAQYRVVRNKGIIFLHRMVPCIGGVIVDIAQKCISIFIQYSDSSDIDHSIQLLNQFMNEFNGQCINAIDNNLGLVIDKIGQLYSALPPGSSSDAETDSTLENDKVSLQKLFLTFMQNVTGFNCHNALASPTNIHRLPEIFRNFITGLQGGGMGISLAAGYCLRRISIVSLTNLSKHWLCSPSCVADHVVNLLITTLCDEALPVVFRLCAQEPADPQAQGFIIDAGGLLWTMASVRKAEVVHYLQAVLLPGLGWPQPPIISLINLLNEPGMILGAFRDSFKKLMKQIRNEYNRNR